MTTGTPGGGSWALALPMPDQKSSFILTGMAAVLVLLLWWLIRAVARQGGARRACRRVAWEFRMTRRAFTAPFRARGLHRRRVRTLTSFLADPAVPALVDHALTGAERAAGEDCRVPAAAVSADRQRVAVVVAGRSPRAATAPWRDARDEPGGWTWSAGAAAVGTGALGTGAEAPPARRTLPLVIGVDRLSGATVVADWMCGPPVVSLEGDIRVARSVLQALAAQLDLLADGPEVQVARGVHPRYPGRELDRILDELEAAAPDASAGSGGAPPVVLACWTPSPAQWERLAALCASGRVRALVGGRLPAYCWSLHTEPGGRLLVPGAGLDVESAALSTAVGSAVKRFRRRGTGWWAARDGQTPPTGPGGDGGGPVVHGSVPVEGEGEETEQGDGSAPAAAVPVSPGLRAQAPGDGGGPVVRRSVPVEEAGTGDGSAPPAAAPVPPALPAQAPAPAPAPRPVPVPGDGLEAGDGPEAGKAPAPAGTAASASGPDTAPAGGAGSPVPSAAPGPTPGTTSALAPAVPNPAPAPAGPGMPGPREGDFAEPGAGAEAAAGRPPRPSAAAPGPPAPDGGTVPVAPGGAVPRTAPAPGSWLEPEPEPGSGTGSRPAPGVSAASRTHPDRTPERP
ncbi:hypothetical protein [Streptomyces roseoverticillatus]|uniref:Type VII secretion protein EccE n=1 Tax=Streptomyces roseoverticillatus TaxID=66429 RepID=A0ABV3IWA6_9ACTN